ncbi:MAG: hypothetical protein P8X58_05500 [Syntrophobacterales bacterium]
MNKFYGTSILASETTRQECGDGVFFREVDRVAVKGRETPVAVYQPLGVPTGLDPSEATRSHKFAKALELYRQGKFSEAGALFQHILGENPEDGPARVFWDRCQQFQGNPPPPDWDGVFRPEQK